MRRDARDTDALGTPNTLGSGVTLLDNLSALRGTLAAPIPKDERSSMTDAIRVAIFDDHRAMRDALVAALEAEGSFNVVGAAETAAEAVACGQDLLPDIVVCDLQMPGGGNSTGPRRMSRSWCCRQTIAST
jgi:Response regulator receiver domain